MKPCDLLNLMMVWMSKYTSFTVRLSDMRFFTVQYALTRPFYPEPGEVQVYFLLYQNAIKLYCVFWLPLFYPDPVKLYSVSPISTDSEELYSVSPYLPISCRHVELYSVSPINLHCILQNC